MLDAGTTIAGKYQLERQLGEGGMGVVWLARHVELGDRRVAIKFLFNALNKNLRERFRREALLASRIQSRHVVQVLDFGEHQGAPYLVMECLEGHDLRNLLDRQRTVDAGMVVAIVAQAARGLQKAHDAGMIHRDIKPENLFLCRDEDGGLLVKVLDFGIAKSVEADSGTATGMMIGTAYYVSPEQFQGVKGIDRGTDLWSLAYAGRSRESAHSRSRITRASCFELSLEQRVDEGSGSTPPDECENADTHQNWRWPDSRGTQWVETTLSSSRFIGCLPAAFSNGAGIETRKYTAPSPICEMTKAIGKRAYTQR